MQLPGALPVSQKRSSRHELASSKSFFQSRDRYVWPAKIEFSLIGRWRSRSRWNKNSWKIEKYHLRVLQLHKRSFVLGRNRFDPEGCVDKWYVGIAFQKGQIFNAARSGESVEPPLLGLKLNGSEAASAFGFETSFFG